eukprot:scaffold752_cov322-Pavlova_lutheri.AAC.29
MQHPDAGQLEAICSGCLQPTVRIPQGMNDVQDEFYDERECRYRETSSADRVQEHSTGSPKTGFAGTSPDCQRASMLVRLFTGLRLRV